MSENIPVEWSRRFCVYDGRNAGKKFKLKQINSSGKRKERRLSLRTRKAILF